MFAFFRAGILSVTIGQVMLLQGLKFDHMIGGLEVPVLKTYACIKVCMYKIPAGRWAVTLFPGGLGIFVFNGPCSCNGTGKNIRSFKPGLRHGSGYSWQLVAVDGVTDRGNYS